jgi:aryl-alcohol dehydrogenase-like predicted oxidoreductase
VFCDVYGQHGQITCPHSNSLLGGCLRQKNRAANQPIIDAVQLVAEEKNATAAQVAIAWLLARKPWIVPIPGTTKLLRLKENAAAASIEFSEQELEEINEVFLMITSHGERSGAPEPRVVRTPSAAAAYGAGPRREY